MEKVEVKLMNAPAGNVLTILEGEALELKHPERIKISGNIESIKNFLAKRYTQGTTGKLLQFVDRETAIVTADEEAMKIVLELDPQNVFGTSVTASLEFTKELEQFKINQPTTFKREEIVKLLRFNARFFADKEKYTDVLTAFQQFKLSTTADIDESKDTRGNKKAAFEKKIVADNNMPSEFILSLPIFKGQKVETFRVEICMDSTEASVRFWFESPELVELIETRRKELFVTQLECCADFVIIHK